MPRNSSDIKYRQACLSEDSLHLPPISTETFRDALEYLSIAGRRHRELLPVRKLLFERSLAGDNFYSDLSEGDFTIAAKQVLRQTAHQTKRPMISSYRGEKPDAGDHNACFPLSKDELVALLTKAEAARNDISTINYIWCRILYSIEGIEFPKQMRGAVVERSVAIGKLLLQACKTGNFLKIADQLYDLLRAA